MVTLNAFALVVALSGAGDTVLLDFTSPTCGPCRTMEPTIGRLTRDGYPIQKIDVSQQPEVAARFQVTGVPCFVMLSNGREVDRVVGACSHARLLQMYASAESTAKTPTSKSLVETEPSGLHEQRPTFSHENVRAQSPDSKFDRVDHSSEITGNPRRAAYEATIRLRIEDASGHSVGTGTIVDRHGNEALAVTCGHIFRDSAGQGRVLVDLFPNGQLRTVEGTLISYDLTRDIGLVSFVPGYAVEPVRIAPAGHQFARGDIVFSVGCDNGTDPSVRESRITSIDRYLGPPNIEATGEPAQGRSGGGLFSNDGYLIGICNHGDPKDDEGIYASLPTIHWELDRVGQRRLYQANVEAIAMQGLSPSRIKPRRIDANPDATAQAVSPVELASAQLQDVPANALGRTPNEQNSNVQGDTEVICIVRSRGNPQSQERVYVLEQPTSDLLDRLARESRSGVGGGQVATRHVQPTSQRPTAIRATTPGEPVVRAQSADRQ
ncbi:MAG: trypsin-like peptidase domain-containing protein [Planctomycetaceae bacterium]|nr:trypsin-like peptidase domain-containing protein [Planctomycetales bacterium]MCB9923508.1 trypsin-like peptidase domain-containing protein [Planctomycetaceae bacterium]